jgi:hypothetical protein
LNQGVGKRNGSGREDAIFSQLQHPQGLAFEYQERKVLRPFIATSIEGEVETLNPAMD